MKRVSSQRQGNEKTSSNVERFHRLACQLQTCLHQEGLEIRVAKGDFPESFSKLNADVQLSQLLHFEDYVEACLELQSEGNSLKDSWKLILKCLHKMNLQSPSHILEKIRDSHIVEIYNKNHIQTFRNLNFFACCSYSLDELMSEPWWKLFRREDEINRQIFYHGSTVLSGDRRETFHPNIPTHLLEEIESPRRYQMYIDIDFMAPVYQDGIVAQAIVLESVRLLA